MAKLTLEDITSGFASTTALNRNNDAIEEAMERVLFRDGTSPNHMLGPLDMNGNIIINQGNPITVTGFNWEGPWVTATPYDVGDVVEDNNSSYICVVAHTSGTFATDLAAGKWQVVASSASLPSQTGNAGKILTTDGGNASWAGVSTLALPISGGTLTGALIGTSLSLTSTLGVTGAASFGSGITVTGSGSFSNDITVTDDLTVSGRIIPSSTEGIKGTSTNDSADAGSIGEYSINNVVIGSAVALVSTISKTVTSMTLSAGDWDVNGIVSFTYGASTSINSLFGGSSLTNNAFDSYSFSHRCAAFVPGAAPMGYAIPYRRISIAVPTTIYLVAAAGFTVSTCSAYGFITARRVR